MSLVWFTPGDAGEIAERLLERKVLVKPLNDARLGPGYMRVTIALPQDNASFVAKNSLVVGPKFRSLHMMFEEQYQDLWNSIDDIAERIRALGQYAPGTCSQFKALATLEETEEIPAADDMLRELVCDNEAVSQGVRNALAVAQEVGDEASAGLLGERLVYHEKQLWMMQSTLAG